MDKLTEQQPIEFGASLEDEINSTHPDFRASAPGRNKGMIGRQLRESVRS